LTTRLHRIPALLDHFLGFGTAILEPDFDLKQKKGKTVKSFVSVPMNTQEMIKGGLLQDGNSIRHVHCLNPGPQNVSGLC
jgi:hypothetical protein